MALVWTVKKTVRNVNLSTRTSLVFWSKILKVVITGLRVSCGNLLIMICVYSANKRTTFSIGLLRPVSPVTNCVPLVCQKTSV